MVDTTTKTKAAMLLELESIKGLLLEEDDIPILQEVEDAEAFDSQHFDLELRHTNNSDVDSVAINTGAFDEEDFDEHALDDVYENSRLDKGLSITDLSSSTTFTAQPSYSSFQETFSNKQSSQFTNTETPKPAPRVIVEEQQDFFDSPKPTASKPEAQSIEPEKDLLNTIDELEKHAAEVTANKFAQDAHKTNTRPSLAKATGENPFLPAHIRSRLHGNNPPPLFAQEAAKKIASTTIPSRLLGNTYGAAPVSKTAGLRNALIDSVIEKFMPEIEKELREKLQTLTKEQLEDLARYNS